MPRWRFFAELANRWNSNVRGRGDFGSHKRRTDGVSDFVFLRNERRSGRNAKLFSRAQPRGPGPRPSQPRRAFVRPRVFAYRTALPALAHPPSLAPCRRSPVPSGASSRRTPSGAGTLPRPASALPAGARRLWRTPGPATTDLTRLPRPGLGPRTHAGSRRLLPPPLPCATPPRRCVSGSARAPREITKCRIMRTNTRKYLN